MKRTETKSTPMESAAGKRTNMDSTVEERTDMERTEMENTAMENIVMESTIMESTVKTISLYFSSTIKIVLDYGQGDVTTSLENTNAHSSGEDMTAKPVTLNTSDLNTEEHSLSVLDSVFSNSSGEPLLRELIPSLLDDIGGVVETTGAKKLLDTKTSTVTTTSTGRTRAEIWTKPKENRTATSTFKPKRARDTAADFPTRILNTSTKSLTAANTIETTDSLTAKISIKTTNTSQTTEATNTTVKNPTEATPPRIIIPRAPTFTATLLAELGHPIPSLTEPRILALASIDPLEVIRLDIANVKRALAELETNKDQHDETFSIDTLSPQIHHRILHRLLARAAQQQHQSESLLFTEAEDPEETEHRDRENSMQERKKKKQNAEFREWRHVQIEELYGEIARLMRFRVDLLAWGRRVAILELRRDHVRYWLGQIEGVVEVCGQLGEDQTGQRDC